MPTAPLHNVGSGWFRSDRNEQTDWVARCQSKQQKTLSNGVHHEPHTVYQLFTLTIY